VSALSAGRLTTSSISAVRQPRHTPRSHHSWGNIVQPLIPMIAIIFALFALASQLSHASPVSSSDIAAVKHASEHMTSFMSMAIDAAFGPVYSDDKSGQISAFASPSDAFASAASENTPRASANYELSSLANAGGVCGTFGLAVNASRITVRRSFEIDARTCALHGSQFLSVPNIYF
jgi:hypothetical protein